MADLNNPIIIQVDVDGEKVATKLNNVEKEIAKVKVEQMKLNQDMKVGGDNAAQAAIQYARNAETLKLLQSEQKALTGQLQAGNDTALILTGSFREMDAQVRALENRYKSLTAAQRESAAGQELKQSIIDGKEQLKAFDAELGNHQRNVGNYPKTLVSAIPGFDKLNGALQIVGVSMQDFATSGTGALKMMGNGMMNLGKQTMAMLANPIMAAIAAVLVVLKMLADAFKRDEEAMAGVQKSVAPFKAIWQNLQRAFDDIVTAIKKLGSAFGGSGNVISMFMKTALLPLNILITQLRASIVTFTAVWSNVGKAVTSAFNSMKSAIANSAIGQALNKISEYANKVKESITNMVNSLIDSPVGKALGLREYVDEMKGVLGSNQELIDSNRRIAESELEVSRMTRGNLKKDADDQLAISQLRNKAAQKDKYNAKERIAFLEEASKKEEAIAQRAYELAKQKYEQEKLRNSLTKSSAADLEREAQAYAAMVNAQTSLNNKQRELNSQLAEARSQEKREQEAAAKEAAQRARQAAEERKRQAEEKRRQAAEERKRRADERARQAEEDRRQAEKEAQELQKVRDDMRRRTQTDLQNQLEDLDNAKAKELAVKGLTEEEKTKIEKYYQDQRKKLKDAAAKAEQDKIDQDEKEKREKREAAEQEAQQFIKSLREESLEEQYKSELNQLDEYYKQGLLMTEEYEAAKAEIESKYQLQKAAKQAEDVQMYLDAVTNLNSAINEVENATLARYEQNQEKQKKSLDERLKAGLISQRDYDAQVSKLDADMERKKIEIERDQAIREKALGIMSATISTATAIIKALADPGGIPGIALSALAGITGAAQIAAIAAQPLPQFATGGVVGGNDYNDGILARVSSGEMIINKQQQGKLFEALSGGNGDNQLGIDYELMAGAMASVPAPVVVYKELQDFGDRVSTFNEIASV